MQLTRGVAHVRAPFPLTTELDASEYVYVLFSHLSTDGYAGCSHILAGVTIVHKCLWTHIPLGYTLRSGIAGHSDC